MWIIIANLPVYYEHPVWYHIKAHGAGGDKGRKNGILHLLSACRAAVFYINYFILFLKILFIYFLEKEKEGEREGEKHQCVVASYLNPPGNLAHNPGMCPTRTQTGDLLVPRPALNPMSHTSQG